MAKQVPTFWVTNMCNRNVSLADLNLTIPAYRTVNLLDGRHYSYTLEQLQKSQQKGSLFAKRTIVSVRKVAPDTIRSDMPVDRESHIPSRERSVLVIKETHYEELELSQTDQKKKEEEFAKESVDEEFAELNEVKPFIATKV
jgi:hypothetical protein